MLSIFWSVSFSNDYRREIRNKFEKIGYELVAFNHESWIMFNVDSIKKFNSYINVVEITDNSYLIERNIVNCKDKTSKAIEQYESINGSNEIKYIVDSPFENIEINSLQYTMFKFTCN